MPLHAQAEHRADHTAPGLRTPEPRADRAQQRPPSRGGAAQGSGIQSDRHGGATDQSPGE